MYHLDELVKVAKRENNSKRNYLYVNPIQGKHIPVSPTVSLQLFFKLAEKIENAFLNESLLVIGFAETATAIGSAIAHKSPSVKYCLNTTRETISGAEYLFFTESHSHATEQRLVTNNLSDILDCIDRIVFAEDEVTTGNTIMKLIEALEKKYPEKTLKFGIASILNSMEQDRIKELMDKNIPCVYISKLPMEYHVSEIQEREYKKPTGYEESFKKTVIPVKYIHGNWESRVVASTETLKEQILYLLDQIVTGELNINIKDNEKILILGTEEFMFLPMYIGCCLEEIYKNAQIYFHATTRSPIEISDDQDYPLHNRSTLDSFYERGRKTFIYNLDRYDQVFVVTDSKNINPEAVENLKSALEKYKNTTITLVRVLESIPTEKDKIL